MAMQQSATPQAVVGDTLTSNGAIPGGIFYQGLSTGSTSQVSSPQRSANPVTNIQTADDEDGIDCSPCCSNETVSRTFRNVAYGQILSLCLCGTGVGSQLLSDRGVNTPTAQSFLNYFLLAAVYNTILLFRKGDDSFWPVLRNRGWRYLLLSFVDVEANYMIVYAYQFTNLTSIQLLDCSTIPVVLLLSWLVLSTRYLITHVIGVGICLVGIAVLIWADALEGKGASGGANRVLGDILCLAGSTLYAVGNVGEEYLVKQNSRVEYLGMIGLFGSIISGIQLALLEHRELAAISWSGTIIAFYLLFAACMFLFYSMVTVLVQKSSALMFNLSILTADFYTLLFGLFLFKYEFHAMYFASFALVILGSVIYSLRDTERRDPDEPRQLCCLFSRCCSDQSNQESIPEQNVTTRLPRTMMANSQMQSSATYMRDVRSCPVHGRRSPFLQLNTFERSYS